MATGLRSSASRSGVAWLDDLGSLRRYLMSASLDARTLSVPAAAVLASLAWIVTVSMYELSFVYPLLATYEAKYYAASECLRKDREVLLTFNDFPAEHWIHVRTTNPIESTFATAHLRHKKTKGNASCRACPAMVFKLCQSVEKRWRRPNSHALIQDIIAAITFTDGENTKAA